MVPKQVVSVSLNAGTWEVIVDGESVGTFEGSWSGEVELSVELKRIDIEDAKRASRR